MTAREKALSLHAQGYNCAQSVLMAEGAYTGLEEKQADAAFTAHLGGGAEIPFVIKLDESHLLIGCEHQ